MSAGRSEKYLSICLLLCRVLVFALSARRSSTILTNTRRTRLTSAARNGVILWPTFSVLMPRNSWPRADSTTRRSVVAFPPARAASNFSRFSREKSAFRATKSAMSIVVSMPEARCTPSVFHWTLPSPFISPVWRRRIQGAADSSSGNSTPESGSTLDWSNPAARARRVFCVASDTASPSRTDGSVSTCKAANRRLPSSTLCPPSGDETT